MGWAGDTATAGFWERVDPQGKTLTGFGSTQPEDDHSAAGTGCFVTDGRGGSWSFYDVNAGITSVVSPPFDWSTRSGAASIGFWSFLFDHSPTDDSFRCWVSNDDGASWTQILEERGMELNDWFYHKLYVRSDEIPFTDAMRFRFTMEDINLGTACAEAAVDDVVIRVHQCFAADVVEGNTLPVRFAVEPNRPNPFNPVTTIRFELPRNTRVDVAVFDAAGRKVRTLVGGERPAGYHAVVWDGHDDADRPVGSGVYYHTVRAGEESSSHKMMLLK